MRSTVRVLGQLKAGQLSADVRAELLTAFRDRAPSR